MKFQLQKLYFSYTNLQFIELVTAISIFLVIVYTYRVSWINPVLIPILTLVVLLFRDVLQKAYFWFVVAIALLLGILQLWFTADNHQWLILLWTLVIAVNLRFSTTRQLQEYLRNNAVLMLALIMLFSVFQKSLETEYMNGDFFTYTLLTYDEFAFITLQCPDITPADLEINQLRVHTLKNNVTHDNITLVRSDCVSFLAKIITYWVIFIEALIGILLLIPYKKIAVWGHVLNIFFIATAYIAAPVIAFGSLLCVLGITATHSTWPRLSFAYFLLLFLLLIYILPVQHIITAIIHTTGLWL